MKEFYKILLEERENDAKRLWTIFSVMNIINAGLFAVVSVKETSHLFQIIAAILGICLCFLWLLSVRRMQGWVELWEEKIKFVEEFYLRELNRDTVREGLTPICSNFGIFRYRENPKRFALGTRIVGWLLPIIFGAAWVGILLWKLIYDKAKLGFPWKRGQVLQYNISGAFV
jgi:hypothetical protein